MEKHFGQYFQPYLHGKPIPLWEGKPTILFLCPTCQRRWLLQGARIQLHVEAAEAVLWASRLQEDLEMLPRTLCRNCAIRFIGGEFAIDEYRTTQEGVLGYGFSWEALQPAVHMKIVVQNAQKALRAYLESGQVPPAQVSSNVSLMRAVLDWFTEDASTPLYQPYSPAQIKRLTQAQRPGAHAPGTEQWVWRGGFWNRWCAPLGGGDNSFISSRASWPAFYARLGTGGVEPKYQTIGSSGKGIVL